jgi:GNAT superfamily N-acetyltransferase
MTTFRLAAPSEASLVAKMHTLSWQNAYRGMLSDQFLDQEIHEMMRQKWDYRFAQPPYDQYILIAEEDGLAQGFVCVYWNDNPVFGPLIDNLHVLPEFKGRGIGKRLMQEVALQLRRDGKEEKYYLWVLEANHPTRQFYEHLGAQNHEGEPHLMPDGQHHIALRYVWHDFTKMLTEV